MASDWTCVPRGYDITKNYVQGYQTYEHPLKLSAVTIVESKGTRSNAQNSFGSNASSRTSSSFSLLAEPLGLALDGKDDPLSQFARQDQELMDPLSQMATEYETFQRRSKKQDQDVVDADMASWSSKRLGILNRFTTSEKLSISTSFLTTGPAGMDTIKSQTVVADKVKYRLEQLDNFEDGSVRHMMNLTQQEYIQRIEQLNQELVQSWNNDQRVKALKIAIQCSKMLSDTSVLQFYPSQFVLITDILDIFGKLVYERLSLKASSSSSETYSKFVVDAQRESARETCQNWFFKIASIRELLPRIYVEMAIIRCNEFMPQCDFEHTLLRISKMIRGIGDPLVATYARCYLVRVGMALVQSRGFIHENFNDTLSIYHMIYSGSIRSELNRQRIDVATYLSLYNPAFDFMLQALVHKSNLFSEETLAKCKDVKNNGPLLISILNAFKPELIAANALDFVKILTNSNTEGVSKGQLFRLLGVSVSHCAPLPEQRAVFLQMSFQTVNTFTDPTEYINCVETWGSFISEYFTIKEINTFLGDIRVRLSIGKAYDKHYTQLQNILDKIVEHSKNIELLLTQENFLPFLDLFHKESVKIEVCKNILTMCKRCSEEMTGDAIATNALMHIGKILNDYVTALTVEDERRQISQLISSFIRRVNYGRDFERQLSFYVEARGAFTNLDGVYITLVHAVNKLAIDTKTIVNGKHTRKTSAFVKACIAYCFITIPSISSIQVQMDLYLLTGQVALLNACLGQANACLEAAINSVVLLPRSIEFEGKIRSLDTYLVSYLCNILATLVVVPDSPEEGVLYLLRLLLSMVNKYPFEPNSSGPTTVYLHALDMLYVQSLEEFPYHIPEVISNDDLYGHDPKFLAEINNMCSQVVDSILNQLKALGTAQQYRTQTMLALDLLLRIVRFADLSKEKTFHLALHLWWLAMTTETHIDPKLIAGTLKSTEEIYELINESNTHQAKSLARLLEIMRNRSQTVDKIKLSSMFNS